jgi:hypothetical protein
VYQRKPPVGLHLRERLKVGFCPFGPHPSSSGGWHRDHFSGSVADAKHPRSLDTPTAYDEGQDSSKSTEVPEVLPEARVGITDFKVLAAISLATADMTCAALILCCWLFSLFPLCTFGQSGQGGNIFFVRPDESTTDFWDSNNCNGESNILRIGFRLNSEKRPSHIGSLMKGQVLARSDGEEFDRDFSRKFLLLFGIRNHSALDTNSSAPPTDVRISPLSIFLFKESLERSVDSFSVPIWHEGQRVNGGDSILIASNYVLDEISIDTISHGLPFCELAGFNRFDGESECRGHLILNNFSQSAHRQFGVRVLVNLFNPDWEIIEHSPSVGKFHMLSINIGYDILAPQKDYLQHCSSRESLAIGPDNNTRGRHDIDDRSGTGAGGKTETDKKRNCEIVFTH